MEVPPTVLRLDSSARRHQSATRSLLDRLIAHLRADLLGLRVISQDLSRGVPLMDEDWLGANSTPVHERSMMQEFALAWSETAIDNLRAADLIALGMPIYNFGVPGSVKLWIDQVCRARETFQYVDGRPKGLLTGKRAIVVIASGGTEVGGEIDHASAYIRKIFDFIGVADVTIVAADRLYRSGSTSLADAELALETFARTFPMWGKN